MKESDLFEPAKQFLLNTMNCEKVYAEVIDLDVVGKHGNVYIGVEMKTSLNFKVIEQAEGRKGLVDYMFILVPKPKTRHAYMIMDWLKSLGIGLMYYDKNVNLHFQDTQISVHHWGKRQRSSRNYNIAKYINEEIDSLNVGGVKGGESITRYKNTIDKIKNCLYLEKGGLTITDLLERVETHYTNPRPSTVATLKANWNLEWCEYVKVDGQWLYRMKEDYRETYWNEYQQLSAELRALRKGRLK